MPKETEKKGTKGIPKVFIIIGIVLVVLYGAGLFLQKVVFRKLGEKAAESIIGKGIGAKVDINSGDGKIKVEGKDGSMEVGTAKWPEDMPTEVPKFSFGTISVALTTNNENLKAWTVIIKDAEQGNFDAYRQELEKKGWQTESKLDFTINLVQMEKGKYQLNLAFDPSSKGISLTVEEKAANP